MKSNKDLALEPVKINFSPDSKYFEENRKWQGIAGIERAQNGRLWATWYSGGRTEDKNNYVLLVTSDDDGLSWSEPVLAIDPPGDIRASDSNLWHDPSGRLWLFWMQNEACPSEGTPFDGRGGVWFIRCDNSGDPKPIWSSPRRIANGTMLNKPIVLSTGEWLLTCAVFSHKGPYPHSLPDEQFSNVVVTRDQGETFERLGWADVPDRQWDEHMIIERQDASLWMLVRIKNGIGEAVSYDRGRTWKSSESAKFTGPASRFHIRRLRSGRLLLIYNYMAKDRSNLTALLSEDEGKTWPYKLLLDERYNVSYPDAIETPEGRILVIYDHNRVGEGEILMQSFTEDDIISNRSPGYNSGRVRIISRLHLKKLNTFEKVVFDENAMIDQKINVELKHYVSENICRNLSVKASEKSGELTIFPLLFSGDFLHLDFSTFSNGSIRVELQDWIGKAIDGYTLDDCIKLNGNDSDARVCWKNVSNLNALSGQLIRMRFVMENADLFSFQFKPNRPHRNSGISIDAPLLGKRYAVPDESETSLEDIKKVLHGDSGYETGFLLSNAPVEPKNQTRFLINRKDGNLIFCALLYFCNRNPMKSKDNQNTSKDDSISLLFGPKVDNIGFMRVGFSENAAPAFQNFLPYPEAKSTAWPLIKPEKWAFQHIVNNPGSIFESEEIFFYAVFKENDVFAFGDAIDFNVIRVDSNANEISSWSFATGMSLDGLLLRSKDVLVPQAYPPEVPITQNIKISITNDPLMVLSQKPYTPARFDGEARCLKNWGVERIHWIDNTGYENMIPGYPSVRNENYIESKKQCGELLPAACKAAKNNGVEFIADIKLFDLSWIGEPDGKTKNKEKIFDGSIFLPMPDLAECSDAFMSMNPEWKRSVKFPITILRIYSLEVIPEIKKSDIYLFESSDNHLYKPVNRKNMKINVRKIKRSNICWTPKGTAPVEGVSDSWMIEVDGIKMNSPFLSIEIKTPEAVLLNRSFATIEAVDSDGNEAPFIIGKSVKTPVTENGFDDKNHKIQRFSFYSVAGGWLTLDEKVTAMNRLSLQNLGVSFIEPETVSGLLEPAHPKAHEIWLDRIDSFLRSNVDGVSIRTLRHHRACSSWIQYAFAPAVREAFERRYNRPVEPTPEDIERIKDIRGEALGSFLTEASRRVKAKGKKFIFQLEVVGGPLNAIDSRMCMKFNLEKWIKDGLFDEIHIKINSGHSPWIRTVLLPFAKQYGVVIHLITSNVSAGYEQSNYRVNEKIVSDAINLGYDGVNFYESANLYELTENYTIQSRAMGEACLRRAAALSKK